MKGRGEIITILCMSVFLICILYAMTYGGIVKAEELEKQPEKVGEKTEVDIEEELRWAEEVKKILKDIGVGFCDEQEDKQEEDEEEAFDQTDENKIQSTGVYAAERAGETVYTKAIERGIGFLLRSQVGPETALYCAAPQKSLGAIRESLHSPLVRIDYVQHAISALIHHAP